MLPLATMLTREASLSRPLPPAKARRSSSSQYKGTPPPPYVQTAPSLEEYTPIESLDVATEIQKLPERMLAELPEGWVEEASGEELSELFVKADDLIKEREMGTSYSHWIAG